MFFSQSDIDALRLICWCQYVQPELLNSIATSTEQENLVWLGLIQQHETSGAFTLTRKGRSFLQELFPLPDLTKSYHKDAVRRRLRLSTLALTVYQGGVHIFTTTPEELAKAPTLFLSAITRNRGANLWGSTRVAAIAHLGDLFCALHYVCPGIGKLALTDELTAFSNQTAQFSTAKRAFIFAGENYGDILTELEADTQTDTKLISYGGVYHCLQLPIHLLSCDATGAVQLQIMAVPDYRRLLTKAALKDQYQPPPPEVPAWDALFRGLPFVMAVDMDLRKIDTAIQISKEQGLDKIVLAALEGQVKEVLIPRYRDTGLARVFVLNDAAISEVTGRPVVPYVPPRAQFLTPKGDVVDAPPIRIPAKAGGQAGRKMRPLD